MNATTSNSLQSLPCYYLDEYNQPLILKSNFLSNHSDYSSLPSLSTSPPSSLFIDKNKNDSSYKEHSSTFIKNLPENQKKIINQEKQKLCTLEKNRIAGKYIYIYVCVFIYTYTTT